MIPPRNNALIHCVALFSGELRLRVIKLLLAQLCPQERRQPSESQRALESLPDQSFVSSHFYRSISVVSMTFFSELERRIKPTTNRIMHVRHAKLVSYANNNVINMMWLVSSIG